MWSSNLQVGDDVAQLQQRLLDMGFTPGQVDGIFGRDTAQALSEFQRNMGLQADGTSARPPSPCWPDSPAPSSAGHRT